MNIVCCGSVAVDRIMSFSGKYGDLIDTSKQISLSLPIDETSINWGGVAANISYHLAKLGEYPSLVASVGDDAEDYIEYLEGVGVDTAWVEFSPDVLTASFTVINDSHNNQIGGFYAGAMNVRFDLDLSDLSDAESLFILSANNLDTLRKQVKQCKAYKLRYVYDIGQQITSVSKKDILYSIRGAEIVILNDYEFEVAKKVTNLNNDDFVKLCNILVVTHGKDGSTIYNESSQLKILASKPSSVKDTTGAGDAYRAGFVYGYSRGWLLKYCGQLGSALASLVIEEVGAQTKYTKNEIVERFEKNYKRILSI